MTRLELAFLAAQRPDAAVFLAPYEGCHETFQGCWAHAACTLQWHTTTDMHDRDELLALMVERDASEAQPRQKCDDCHAPIIEPRVPWSRSW